MKFTFTGVFEVDFDEELKRLHKYFKGAQLKRQLNIIDLFKAEKFNEAVEAYNALPYCEKGGCPEQEFVGLWFSDITNGLFHNKFVAEGFKIAK